MLPVITRGTSADEVNASLKKSYLWPLITKCELKINMRIVSFSKDNRQFSIDLLQTDNGVNNFITLNNLNNLCALVKNVQELTEKVYPGISNISTKPLNWFQERAILSPTNEQIDKMNDFILSKFEASSQTYHSVDTVVDRREAVHYPTHFSISLTPLGIPPQKLILKVGSLVILPRNLNPPKVINGTRLKVVNCKSPLIECTVLTGKGNGEIGFYQEFS